MSESSLVVGESLSAFVQKMKVLKAVRQHGAWCMGQETWSLFLALLLNKFVWINGDQPLNFVFFTFLNLKLEETLCHFLSLSQGPCEFNQAADSFLLFEERLLYGFSMLCLVLVPKLIWGFHLGLEVNKHRSNWQGGSFLFQCYKWLMCFGLSRSIASQAAK